MRFVKYSSLLLLFFLVGCQGAPTFQARNKEYLSAYSIPPLKIPPGISSNAFHNEYPVSDKNYPESAKNVSVIPPGLYSQREPV